MLFLLENEVLRVLTLHASEILLYFYYFLIEITRRAHGFCAGNNLLLKVQTVEKDRDVRLVSNEVETLLPVFHRTSCSLWCNGEMKTF